MGMCQDHNIDFFDFFVIEIRCQDIFPDVEGTVQGASPVHHHFLAPGKPDQCGVALTDIHKGDGQVSGMTVFPIEKDAVGGKEDQADGQDDGKIAPPLSCFCGSLCGGPESFQEAEKDIDQDGVETYLGKRRRA